jgi:hypothetical protein
MGIGQWSGWLVLYQPSNRLTRTRAEIPSLFKRMVPAARDSDYVGWYYIEAQRALATIIPNLTSALTIDG